MEWLPSVVSMVLYLAGWYFGARTWMRRELERLAQHRALLRMLYPKGSTLIFPFDRSNAWGEGIAINLVAWWIYLPCIGIKLLHARLGGEAWVPPTERARLEQQELEEARRIIAEYDKQREAEQA